MLLNGVGGLAGHTPPMFTSRQSGTNLANGLTGTSEAPVLACLDAPAKYTALALSQKFLALRIPRAGMGYLAMTAARKS